MPRPALLWLCLALLWPAERAAAAPAPDGLEGFDAFVEEVMAEWQVPGLAVAAVEDGRIVVWGAEDLVVVDAGGLTVVMPRERAPRLKDLLKALPEETRRPDER